MDETNESSFPPLVATLMTLGEPDDFVSWLDYPGMGIGPAHIPDLVAILGDSGYWRMDETDDALWTPLHAWRALGQLQAEDAVEALVALLRRADEYDDDWLLGDLPEVLGMIGVAAIPALDELVGDTSAGVSAQISAAEALAEVGKRHADGLAESVDTVVGHLQRAPHNDPTVNGFLVYALMELKATEAAPVIEAAFGSGNVDESIAGDWEDVQVAMGLKNERAYPRTRPYVAPWFGTPQNAIEGALPDSAVYADDDRPSSSGGRSEARKAKAKRKQAKEARKRNRKRKK
jgi:hypothetical protein